MRLNIYRIVTLAVSRIPRSNIYYIHVDMEKSDVDVVVLFPKKINSNGFNETLGAPVFYREKQLIRVQYYDNATHRPT